MLCILNNKGYRHTLRKLNIYCFSSATMVTRTCLNIALYVHCLSCLNAGSVNGRGCICPCDEVLAKTCSSHLSENCAQLYVQNCTLRSIELEAKCIIFIFWTLLSVTMTTQGDAIQSLLFQIVLSHLCT